MEELINLLHAPPKFYDRSPRHKAPTFGVAYGDGTQDTGFCSVRYEGDYSWIFVRPLAA